MERFPFKPTEDSDPKVNYIITVETSDEYVFAGTSKHVLIELVAEDGRTSTGFLTLHNYFSSSFKKSQVKTFVIPAKEVGFPILIRIKFGNSIKDDWFCNFINVGIAGDEKSVTFPIYDWITEETNVMPGEALLPQTITNLQTADLRRQEVEKNKALFEWVKIPLEDEQGWGLPRYVNAASIFDLPAIFKHDDVRGNNFISSISEAGISGFLDKIDRITSPIRTPDDFSQLHDSLSGNRNNFSRWKDDDEMGRQVLTGVSPLIITQCTALPEHFNVTNDDIAGLLEDGKSLEDEMKAGKVYIADYVDLVSGIERNEGLVCADSCGLFYVKGNDFLPIAIQLVPNDRDYLFTPRDRPDDWLLAKVYFRGSMSSIHQWISHFLLTHGIAEPFAVAVFRCFPKSHPLYKLLRPHLRTVMEINTLARSTLINQGSTANKGIALSALDTTRKFFETFAFDDLIIPKRLKKQGLDNPDQLPGFYYRDDALMLWKVMEKYVDAIIRHYYKSDKDVVDDFELQGWADDVANNGLNWQKNNDKRMPDKITSVEQLIEICVTIIFTSSAQHAAVNFGQFETYQFCPNSPGCMRLAPHKKGEGTEERIMNSLPDRNQAASIVAITYALSQFSPNEVYIGKFPHEFFTEQSILEIQDTYSNELAELQKTFAERNAKVEEVKQYTYLLPEEIPNSIAI